MVTFARSKRGAEARVHPGVGNVDEPVDTSTFRRFNEGRHADLIDLVDIRMPGPCYHPADRGRGCDDGRGPLARRGKARGVCQVS